MDSKTKHRILGVLVIVGLGVLVYPLLQSNNEMPNEQVLVKAPPFPDQASQLNPGPTPTVVQDEDKAASAAVPVPSTSMPDSAASSENVTPDEGPRQLPDDTIAPSPSANPNIKAPEITATPPAGAAPSPSSGPTSDNVPVTQKSDVRAVSVDAGDAASLSAPLPEEKSVHASLKPRANKTLSKKMSASVKSKISAAAKPNKTLASAAKVFSFPRQDDSNGLLKLNQTSWVIQVGSFKQKAAAMHLVNQLRENGYRAFIQQLPSDNGSTTQVYVGPENRQHLARALATQLQTDMQVKGIVVSYQPFAL